MSLISNLISVGSFTVYYLVLVPATLIVAVPVALFLYHQCLRNHIIATSQTPECLTASQQEGQKKSIVSSTSKTATPKSKKPSREHPIPIRNRIVMTKEIDSLLRKMIDNLVEYYLLVWYRPLVVLQESGHRHHEAQESLDRLRQLLRENLWMLISCFIDRLYTVNYVTFLSHDLVNRLLKHFQNLNHSAPPPPTLFHDTKEQMDEETGNIHPRTFGHRKNQSSISSIFSNNSSTSISSTASEVSSISADEPPPSPSLASQIKQPFQTFLHNQQTKSHSLFHNFPFMGKHGPQQQQQQLQATQEAHRFPLASHLIDVRNERKLLKVLVAFILDTLFRDINNAAANQCTTTMMLMNDCRVLKTLLCDLLSKILFDLIETVSAPKIINCQIVMILKQYFLLKELLFNNDNDNMEDINNTDLDDDGDGQDQSSDDSDQDDGGGSDGGDGELKLVRRNLFILNEMKRCIIENDFDNLYELIDKCNNLRLLKHIRLKLIGEILDATVVSHLNKNNNPAQSYWYDDLDSETSSIRNGKYVIKNNFNFNAKMNLKFKKYRQEKNIKRLKTRLQFAKTLCEQKIQFRKRNAAQRLMKNESNEKMKPREESFSFQNSEFLVKSFSLDDSVGLQHHQQQQQQRPRQKKIFKFHQIMANKFSREYFKNFMKQSLLQNDESKRSSLMKFRKDVLLVDCTVYMLEFWEHLQMIFEYFCDTAPPDFETYRNSYNLILTMVTDPRFFYTFSKQFLTISPDLMRSLERFLLGDIELDSLDLYGREPFFHTRNIDHNFILQTPMEPNPDYVLSRINWTHYLSIFIRLEKILFNCLNEEFFPQFLISDEYDQMLYRYFEQRKNGGSPLMDLERELASDRWIRCADDRSEYSSVLVKLNHLAKLKPLSKIFLSTTTGGNGGESFDHRKSNTDKQSLDLHKNRKMLFNSIEFPFVYICYVKLVLLARLKLKMAIRDIFGETQDGGGGGLEIDIRAILERDIKNGILMIEHLHRILMRVFCWLNADFSCTVTNVHFRKNYAELLQSSTSHTTESKIMSFMENLFSRSGTNSNENQKDHVSAASNLMFQVHVTALLSKFQYNRDQGALPITIRNELMSNWSYQWTTETSLDLLQMFYQKTVKPFVRIIIFLARFHVHGYLTAVHNRLGSIERRNYDHRHVVNVRILEKFLYTSGHILNEMKQSIREEIRKLSVPLRLIRQGKPKPETQQIKSGSISFRKLLERDIAGVSVDQAAQEATPELLMLEETLKPESKTFDKSSQQDDQMKQMENLLNILFQQMTAQEHVVKSLGFLSFVGYEQEDEQKRRFDPKDPGPCPRCLLVEQLFDSNQDYGLNHQIQLFLFQLLFAGNPDQDQEQLIHQLMATGIDERESLKLPLLIHVLVNPSSSSNDIPQQQKNDPNEHDPTPRLLFMQARSLLAEKLAPDVFDFTLDSLRCFDPGSRTDYCARCCGVMSMARRKLSAFTPEMPRPNGSRAVKFRLFNHHQSDDGEDNRSGTVSNSSSSDFKFGIGSILSSFTKNHRDETSSTGYSTNSLPDMLLNEAAFCGDHDDPPLLSYDESQLVEPLFQLLIEIFELKGGVVTRTLRRTLMFGIRLFLGQTKMMSRPYLQFLQSFFTEKNMFKMFWQLNLYLETLLSQQNRATTAVETAEVANPEPVQPAAEEEPSKIDEYLADLNQLLCSFEASAAETAQQITESENDRQHSVMIANELEQQQQQKQQVAETEAAEAAERERKLQIIAKQLLFVSTPTFLNHLFGQENINKGLNKCFDALQYQQLNKHLIYEFIEAFMLEYFPEFRKL